MLPRATLLLVALAAVAAVVVVDPCASGDCSTVPSGPSEPLGPPRRLGSFSPISDGGDDGNGKRYFYAGSPENDSNSRAAIPLLTFTLIAFIVGLICVTCVGSFAPKAASKVGQVGFFPRMAANRALVAIALVVECVLFLLILVVIGVNTWSVYTSGTGNNQATWKFGVYSVTVETNFITLTAWYSCDLADGASDDYKKQCGAFLGGCVMTMFYEMFFGISGLVAVIMLGLGTYRKRYSAGMYKAHAIATVASVAALFNWALSSHLILTSELKALQPANTSYSFGFGASWGLLIPIFLFAVVLGLFWRAVIETLPLVAPGAPAAAGVPAVAMGVPVGSPQQFSPQQPYMPEGQQAQFAPQPQFAPQQQYVPHPAVQPGMDQQGMGPGYVAPEAAQGGFAQI